MEHKTWTTADKSSWGDGPWQDEPDKEQWQDETTGLPCLIKRNQFGSLCGYVGIAENHPWYGKRYDELPAYPLVHGGINFAASCDDEGPEAETICHIPGPGEPDRVWWLGFDCGHGFDICPAMESRDFMRGLPPLRISGAEYRTVGYVKSECASLARQIAAEA